MGTPRKAEPGGPIYKAALASMSPELAEAFKEVSVLTGISEDDVIHIWILSQAKLLDATFKAHTRDVTAAVQSQLHGLIQGIDRIRQDQATADAKQTSLFSSNLEEIRRRQAKLAEDEAKGWPWKVINNGLLILFAAFLGGLMLHSFDGKRLNEANAQAHEREKALLASLPYATRLEVLLERHGGRMESQPGRVVIHPGKDTIKNAYRDAGTGDAVIVYQ